MIAVENVPSLSRLVGINADKIKAILVIFVVADHNEALRQIYPQLFAPLTFHVLGFLLLSFTFGTKYLSTRFILDRAARYLIPFWWVVTASSVLFSVLYLSKESLPEFFIRWSLAVMIGNAPFVKSSSGLMMLWFMPCLFGLSCLLACYDSLKSNCVRYSAIGLAILAHLAIPLMPHTPMLWLPFGLAIAMDIFILGLLWRRLLRVAVPKWWGLMSLSAFIASYAILVSRSVHLEVATLSLAGISSPAILVLQDVSGMAGFLSVIWLSSMLRNAGWLESIGKQSLLVYLLHPFVYILLNKLWRTGSNAESSLLMLLVNGVMTLCLAVGLAYLMAIVVARSSVLSDWFTPRSLNQWPPMRLFVPGFPSR